MPTFLFIFAAGILVSARSLGQSVAWTDPGPIPPQAGIQLDLVFTDCQPKGGINLPSVAGLQFSGSPGRATSFSMINFQTSSSTTLSYVVQAGQVGRIQIPSFTVETDKGRATVSGLALEVAASSANRARQQNPFSPNFPFAPSPLQNQSNPGSQVVPSDAVQAATEAEPRRPYVGEVFDVNYRVVMTGNRSGRVKTTPLWDVQNFTAEAWDRGQQIGPGGSQGLQFHTKAMVPKAGLFQLPSIRQKLDIDTAAGGRSFFFTAPGSVEVEAVAAPVPLNVEPLPANAPAGFQGAVGQFGLESKLVPEQVNEGEPVTWTLTLRGTGNWPMGVELPARSVPKEIRTIQPKLRREFNGTEIFTGAIVEDLVMIPTKSGEFELPSVKFHFFDPKKKAYETAEIKPPKVVVVKQTGGLALPNPPVGTVTGLPATSKKTGSVAKGKTAQALVYGEPGLPREPVAAGGMGLPPVDRAGWMLAAMLPWLVLLGVWWRWAKKSAARTDPERPRKEALKNWKKAIQMVRLMGLTEREREKALLFWQKAVAGTLGIEGATPAWTTLLSGLATMEKADQENLARCWSESENGLYGRNPNLDGGWCDQAEQLATRIDLPALKAWDWLRPRNLFPWLSTIILLGAAAAPVCAQLPAQGGTGGTEGPIELYQAGRFTEAEKIWREKVIANPRDPIAKNNLALAYFQLGEKERALAYGLSAYLISPSAATVGWNTRIFAQSADQLDRAVLGLWNEGGAEWLSARLGVFGWQAVFVLSMTGAVIGLGLGLAAGYFPRFRTFCFRLGVGTGGVGLVGLLTAVAALGVYGKLADRNAVIVVDLEPLRSIPTEVEPQAEKAYPPGSVARLEKSFLGWSKIRLPNEDAGWIRNEHIVRLY